MRFPFKIAGEPGAAEQAIVQLRDAHAQILCGTDAPNPGTAYGASMHEELALLVTAGLSASAALIAATSAPGEPVRPDRPRPDRPGSARRSAAGRGRPYDGDHRDAADRGVWRGGQRFDRDGYRARLAAAPHDAEAEVPPGELGMVSDFDAGPAASFGQSWVGSAGRASKAHVATVAGAHGSKGALGITGEVAPATMGAWAGAIWMPGGQGVRADEPVEQARVLVRRARRWQAVRGDGVRAQARPDARVPSRFSPAVRFATVSFTWSQFDGLDGKDVAAIFIGAMAAGPVDLAIDDFQLQ